jgi:hypothetical protein
MRRPSLLALAVVAAWLPFLALAAPESTPVPVPGSFDRVALRGDFDVEVREGSPAAIEVVAEPGWAERIEVDLSGSELRLSRKRDRDSAKGVLVKVTLPSFRALSVAGSGKGTAESGPSPRDVRLSLSGSGDLSWKGVAAALDVSLAGSGDVKLAGKGQKLTASLAGSGDIDAKELPVKDASVAIAGSGDVSLRLAGGALEARIAGSGDVEWSGEGTVGAVSTAGSGRVRQR